ncbi:hypothetical protein PZ895_00970 [Mesorhizobium sp. YIM 152430]|jgi:hypothetical protein|uniref:hypothetical protein n=1 Tax=Mesorhizobium sp. YIM 152430 TaxID=3031761 RepID=UPI0023DCA87F|nr:hypothetical protein [Mesorhizobium sp. YIM 152430]MDF1598344.1 hypothetical protein [Mesorhizobium sp. YIM 152430]
MKTFIIVTTAAAALALSGLSAQAGGWGGSNSHNYSSGLINVSPSVRTGNVNLLNGTSVLNNSPIASGNVVSGILSGNQTGNGIGNGNGILGGTLGILGGNSSKYSVRKGRR